MQMPGKLNEFKIPDELFLKIKTEAEIFYKQIKPVPCPYLKKNIVFNKKGLDHIKLKSWQRGRNRFDQYTRLKFLKLVPGVLSKSHTLQGFKQSKEWERVNDGEKGWSKIQLEATFYEFVAVVSKVRIRIIIKELPGGEPYFWSIIPFWKMTNVPGERLLFDGNPAED